MKRISICMKINRLIEVFVTITLSFWSIVTVDWSDIDSNPHYIEFNNYIQCFCTHGHGHWHVKVCNTVTIYIDLFFSYVCMIKKKNKGIRVLIPIITS